MNIAFTNSRASLTGAATGWTATRPQSNDPAGSTSRPRLRHSSADGRKARRDFVLRESEEVAQREHADGARHVAVGRQGSPDPRQENIEWHILPVGDGVQRHPEGLFHSHAGSPSGDHDVAGRCIIHSSTHHHLSTLEPAPTLVVAPPWHTTNAGSIEGVDRAVASNAALQNSPIPQRPEILD